MDDPIVSCISYVIKKTCITLGKLLQFLGLRFLDLMGLIFNILAFCTIIRIPGLIDVLVNDGGKFKWRWKYAGIWQLAVFILDIPLLMIIPFYLLCPWRIWMVITKAIEKKEFDELRWEGWAIRARIYKHFVLLLFDMLSIPFAICLALSWRSLRVRNLFDKAADKKEITVKIIIVTQFLHLLGDIILMPFIILLLCSWRLPIIIGKYRKLYFAKDDNELPLVKEDADMEMKVKILWQFWLLFIDICSIPPVVITIFTWRLIPFIMACLKNDLYNTEKGLSEVYAWVRWKCWRQLLYILLDLPCILFVFLLAILFPIVPWRLIQLLRPQKKKQQVEGAAVEHMSMNRIERNLRKRICVAFGCALIDLMAMTSMFIVTATLWRLPHLIHDLITAFKIEESAFVGSNEISLDQRFKRKKSCKIWVYAFKEFILIFCDLLLGIMGFIVLVTLWRAYPLILDIKKAFEVPVKDKSLLTSHDQDLELVENVSMLTVNGMKIRKGIIKHFTMLLLDVPAILLCLVHMVFIIKIPAIISVAIGGNFYMEFAITVYLETAKLVVDIIFLFICLFMCFIRPVAIWVHICEDDKHKKQRISSDMLVHVKWLLQQRGHHVEEAESLLQILTKEPLEGPIDYGVPKDFNEYTLVNLAKVFTRYTKKLIKIRDTLYEDEMDDKLIYSISRVIFFENKAAYMMTRKYQIEKLYIENSCVISRRRNVDLNSREEASYSTRREVAVDALVNFQFEKVPLWDTTVGFRQRTRKETQKAIIAAVTSGNFVTILLSFINLILIYRFPKMIKSVYNAPHLRRNIAVKTLRNYCLDFIMLFKILLICLSIYKVPDLVSALVVNLFHKRSVTAARKAVNAIPSDIFKDLCRALGLVFSYKTIPYVGSSLLFLILMPLSVMVKTYTTVFHSSFFVAYLLAGLLYLSVLVFPFLLVFLLPGKVGVSMNLSFAIAAYVATLVIILIMYALIKAKSLMGDAVKRIDYVRINWYNIHIYFKMLLEFLQLVAILFAVKMSFLYKHEIFADLSKYILLDVYDPMIKFSFACAIFILWFLTASVPIVLEGVLKFVSKGTFTKGHFTWRAFLSFFGSTLFMVIPEVGLSFLSCDYSNCKDNNSSSCAVLFDDPGTVCWSSEHKPFAILSMFGIMWYVLTSTLICSNFNDVQNRKLDLQFSSAYTMFENFIKLSIVTTITLFRDEVYCLAAVSLLLFVLLLMTGLWRVLTRTAVCNHVRLLIWKIGLLYIVLCCAVCILVVEKMEISSPVALYVLAGVVGGTLLVCLVASFSRFGIMISNQEKARRQFKKVLTKLISDPNMKDNFVGNWKNIIFAFRRLLRNVRVAHPKDKEFDQILPPPDNLTDLTVAPPSYEDIQTLDLPSAPPSYDSVVNVRQEELQADDHFVPSASIYLTPQGDWEPYDAGIIVEKYGWMLINQEGIVMHLDDTQCNGSDLLLLLEQSIKYATHNFEFIQRLGSWRETVRSSTWEGLLQCAESLQVSLDAGYGRPQHQVLTYDAERDLLQVLQDSSTFPMYFEVADISSRKMAIHAKELVKLLGLIPEPWKAIFEKIIPVDKPVVHKIVENSDTSFTVELFKSVHISIDEVGQGGFKVARGAKIVLPKTINISHITELNLTLGTPYLSGSKGPITKQVSQLSAQKIGEDWYLILGKNRAKISKILATLGTLSFSV